MIDCGLNIRYVLQSKDWCTTSKGKLHTLLGLDIKIPDFIHITDEKQTDAKSTFEIPASQGEIIVVDQGYQDFKILSFGDSKHAFFVVRNSFSSYPFIIK